MKTTDFFHKHKVWVLCAAMLLLVSNSACSKTTKTTETMANTKILFINGSQNKDGNTAELARILLDGHTYESLYLTDYRINFYGQETAGDQLEEIIAKMKEANIVVIGSPVYWHNICASVRTVMERFYGYVGENTFRGKKLFFLYQGAAPTQMMIDDGEYSMSRFARMYGFTYEGMATNKAETRELRSKL